MITGFTIVSNIAVVWVSFEGAVLFVKVTIAMLGIQVLT